MVRRHTACLAALALALLGRAASAQPAPPPAPPTALDKSLAEALFRDAKALLDDGKVSEACAKLAESHRIEPKPGTVLNLASCYEKLGRTASAWAAYNESTAMAGRAGQADREDYARQRAAAMEAQLSRLKLDVSDPLPGIEVKLDGRVLSAATWGTAIPVDPGEHTIDVAAPGHKPRQTRVMAMPGPATLSIEIPRPEPSDAAPAPAPAAAPPPPPPSPAPAPVEAPDTASQRRIAGYVVGGVGLAGVVVGSIFGVLTFVKKSQGDRYCTGTPCTQQGLDLENEASTSATVSTVSFAVGLAAVGGGVALVVTARPSKPPQAARVWIAPVVGPNRAGLAASGSW